MVERAMREPAGSGGRGCFVFGGGEDFLEAFGVI
jgi:hypothetical protein